MTTRFPRYARPAAFALILAAFAPWAHPFAGSPVFPREAPVSQALEKH